MTTHLPLPTLCPRCQSPVRETVGGLCAECLSQVAFWSGEQEQEEPPIAERVPLELGSYVVHEEIGRGGMGVVYRARQRGLEREVALKVIAAGPLADPELLRRFRSEAKAAARLQHPHIVPVHEVGEGAGHAFLSMELIHGPTLTQRVKRGGPLVPHRAAACLVKVAAAIQHAHGHDLLHRDIKPSNILLDPDEEPFVVDFGLAKSLNELSGQELTLSRQTVGTPGYFAPEQAEAHTRLDVRTDVYALGAVLYFTLTGRPPFPGQDMATLLQQVRFTEPSPPRLYDGTIPRDLETICLKALEKNPAKRYPTAQAMAEDLSRFLAGDPILARPLSPLGRTWRWVLQHRALSAALASLFTVLSGTSIALSMLWFKARDSAQQETASLHQAEDELWRSLIVTARNERLSGRAGNSERALAALRRAAQHRISVELKDEAIAALAMPDFVPLRQVSWRGVTHDFQAREIAFHPRLDCAVAGLSDGREVVLDAETGAIRHALEGFPSMSYEDPIFSSTGRYLTTIQPPSAQTPEGKFFTWEVATGKQIPLPTIGQVRTCGWNLADTRLVLLHPDSVEILSVPEGRIERSFVIPPDWRGPSLSPDENTLALDYGSTLRLFDARTGTPLRSLDHAKEIVQSAWNTAGTLLAVGSKDWQLHVWDVATGYKWSECRGHDLLPGTQTFVAASDWLLSGSWDGTWRLWEARTGRSVSLLAGGDFKLVLGSRQTLVSSLQWPEIQFKTIRQPTVVRFAREPTDATAELEGTQAITWSHDGRFLFTAGSRGGINAWEALTLRHCSHIPGSYVTVAANTKNFLSFSGEGGWKTAAWTATSDADGHAEALQFQAPQQVGPTYFCNHFSQSADGTTTAVSTSPPGIGYGQRIEIWRGGQKTKEWNIQAAWPTLALSPNGSLLATGGFQACQLELFDTADAQPVKLAATPAEIFEPSSLGCTFSPDGRTLAVIGAKHLTFWDVATRRIRHHLERPMGALDRMLNYSPDGRWLAAAGGNRDIWLLDPDTGQRLATLISPLPVMPASLAFSPDSQQLAVALVNRTVQVWDLQRLSQELQTTLGMSLR